MFLLFLGLFIGLFFERKKKNENKLRILYTTCIFGERSSTDLKVVVVVDVIVFVFVVVVDVIVILLPKSLSLRMLNKSLLFFGMCPSKVKEEEEEIYFSVAKRSFFSLPLCFSLVLLLSSVSLSLTLFFFVYISFSLAVVLSEA